MVEVIAAFRPECPGRLHLHGDLLGLRAVHSISLGAWRMLSLSVLVLLGAACTSPSEATPGAPTQASPRSAPLLQPSGTLAATPAPAASEVRELAPISTLEPLHTSSPAPEPAAAEHALLFTANQESSQSVFLYQLETDTVTEVYTLPASVSLHDRAQVEIHPFGTSAIESFPPGLPEGWMFLSPDGIGLVTLQPAYGGRPNYLHQIDLMSGRITSTLIFENYRLALPASADRRPNAEPLDEGLEPLVNVAYLFYGLAWQPSGAGLGFILGTAAQVGVVPQQIYYNARGRTTATPLGLQVPGSTSGYAAEWSPDGRYLAYVVLDALPNPATIWLIDLQHAEAPLQLGMSPFAPRRLLWTKDSSALLFQDSLPRVVNPDLERLVRLSRSDGRMEVLLEVEEAEGETVEFHLGATDFAGDPLIIYESHRVAGADRARPGRLADDFTRSRILVIDLPTGEIESFPSPMRAEAIRISPDGRQAWVFQDPQHCAVISLPAGAVIAEPEPLICRAPVWSPDGYYLAGGSEGGVLIFDPARDRYWTVGDYITGEKVFLGWVADPGAFDELISTASP